MIKRIVIAGGGTAGWMAASLMHHRWASKGIQICLVESPNIGIIGVGEGSTPTLKRFFSDLAIAESDWMPECNATYKVNIEFLRKQMDKVLEDIEELKDKNRDMYYNGNGVK